MTQTGGLLEPNLLYDQPAYDTLYLCWCAHTWRINCYQLHEMILCKMVRLLRGRCELFINKRTNSHAIWHDEKTTEMAIRRPRRKGTRERNKHAHGDTRTDKQTDRAHGHKTRTTHKQHTHAHTRTHRETDRQRQTDKHTQRTQPTNTAQTHAHFRTHIHIYIYIYL